MLTSRNSEGGNPDTPGEEILKATVFKPNRMSWKRLSSACRWGTSPHQQPLLRAHAALKLVEEPASKRRNQQPGGSNTTGTPYGKRKQQESGQGALAETEGSGENTLRYVA